jgi:hypothetical protein
MRMGLKMKVAAVGLIYRKSLQLGNGAFFKTTAGQVANLISNDVNRMDKVNVWGQFLWLGPMEAGVSLWLLWGYIGVSVCLPNFGVYFIPLYMLSSVVLSVNVIVIGRYGMFIDVYSDSRLFWSSIWLFTSTCSCNN